MSQDSPITSIGFKAINEELEKLIKEDREQIKSTISEARELGDLKENAEYHAAKEKQAMIEGRIQQLQSIVASSNVIDVSTLSNDKIVFGATVVLTDVEKEKELTYQIVGEDESDRTNGKVSYNSPLGRALLGKEEGDEVTVKAPKGDIEYVVESFKYK